MQTKGDDSTVPFLHVCAGPRSPLCTSPYLSSLPFSWDVVRAFWLQSLEAVWLLSSVLQITFLMRLHCCMASRARALMVERLLGRLLPLCALANCALRVADEWQLASDVSCRQLLSLVLSGGGWLDAQASVVFAILDELFCTSLPWPFRVKCKSISFT